MILADKIISLRKKQGWSQEEMAEYLSKAKKAAVYLSSGVALCIMSPILLILLAGLSGEKGICSENIATGVGVAMLLVMVAIAVGLFLLVGFKLSKYEYLEKEDLELAYGVAGAVADKKEKFTSFSCDCSIFICLR